MTEPEQPAPASDTDSGPLFRTPRRHVLAAALVILVYLLFRTPSPEYYLMDPDGGVQLAAAQQIRLTGEQPWVDFYVPYGPLVYYMSFLGQWLSGDRLIGEIVLCILGYATAYLLLFLISHRLSESLPVSWFILICLLILMPRFYKYYVVLVPTIVLTACLAWLHRPSRLGASLVGFSVAAAALIRIDLGAFSAAATAVALVFAVSGHIRRRLIQVLLAGAWAIAPPLAWLLLTPDGLVHTDVFRQLGASLFRTPRGMALPNPLFHRQDPVLSVCYLVTYLIVVALVVRAGTTWRWLDRRSRAEIATLFTLGVGCFTMANHRADFAHLVQGVPILIVSCALLWPGKRDERKASRAAPAVALVLVLAALGLGYVRIQGPESPLRFGSISLRDRLNTLSFAIRASGEPQPAGATRPAGISHMETVAGAPGPAGRGSVVWPYAPQTHYFARTPFASCTPILLPGLFDTDHFQSRIVESLRGYRGLVLWNLEFAVDGRPERNPAVTHSRVFEFVALHRRTELAGAPTYAAFDLSHPVVAFTP